MRATLTVSLMALLAVSGCASRETMRALQSPAPAPTGLIRFESDHAFRDAVALEWIGGVSRHSYIFAEPNQNVMRPLVLDALADSGLHAGTSVRARYGLRILVDEARGPQVGADFESAMSATYTLIERSTGAEVWSQQVSTPGAGYFLAFHEADWRTAWFIDPIVAAVEVGNPFNYAAFASDSAAERARREGLHGGEGRARAERWGHERAARANHAAVATNVTAFLAAFASDNNVEIVPILPCWGSPEVEARKLEIRAAGGEYTTDDCNIRR